jgi:hypothetical protein
MVLYSQCVDFIDLCAFFIMYIHLFYKIIKTIYLYKKSKIQYSIL